MKNNSFNQRDNHDSDHQRGRGGHNNQQGNQHYDKRRQQGQQQQNYQSNQRDQNGQRSRSNNREQSGQRQHPDSSMGRNDAAGLHGLGMSNLGSVKFTPGFPTRELPPIETKTDPNKKFTGKCRLFVGNLPHNTSEEKVRRLFEPFGEIGEIFLGPKSSYAFIKMDTKATAEAARDALDCTQFNGRELRVRLTAHASAIRVKHLSPQVTNELLAYAFRFFGEIERAVVVVDDKGKSICEGIVEFARKQSALYAIKKCQTEAFLLTAGTKPVLVESFLQHDEEEGLPERSFNKNSVEFNKEREVGPRFAEQGSFEHSFANRWKELYEVERQKREALENEILQARNDLQGTISLHQHDYEQMTLQKRIQELEAEKRRLQQLREQKTGTGQQRDEQRHQQDLILRQREDEIIRRQQMSGMNQQDPTLRNQSGSMQDMLSSQDPAGGDQQNVNSSIPTSTGQAGQEPVPVMSINSMMRPKSFAELAAMNANQPYIQVPAPPMSLPNHNPPPMFQNYIPPPPIQGTLNDAASFGSYQQTGFAPISNDQQATTNEGGTGGRNQQRFNRQFTTQGNIINVTPVGNNPRPRKRGRF